jgi:signal transduction histidine kinase
MALLEPEFRVLFEQSPDILLVLLPDAPRFTMVAATEARYRATHTTRETLGMGLFELFPDNPDDPAATGTSNLRASLERVVATRAPDTMAVQKYDIRGPDGSFEVKYWSPKNLPVLSAKGELLYILHRVEDVTELVKASELGQELKDRTQAMEREVIRRSQELSAKNGELRAANARLGELDAAKTAFFSNVSHEFRTPLTLMLGPIEDALADGNDVLSPRQRERVQLAHDHMLRLLKLVNALLDFARLEAGRLKASYAPLDLSTFTAELAGMFQSAAERAGVGLVVDCPPTSEPAWVDREMWEKIVPNLLSNAMKFTFQGAIATRLREEPSRFALGVSDSGVGIPESELPRIFERFHRVAGQKGRTHEGTGIGLSLVKELVALHGGSVTVQSELGRGTTFRVEIPKGHAHLPADAVSQTPVDPRVGRDAAALALEAERWTPESVRQAPVVPGTKRASVLVVDDNPDLRAYIATLLAPDYEVEVATDGAAALDAIAARVPDLVVSDVMMPRLDGVGMLRELRASEATALLPVILLSARAGQEAAIEGLDAGCDDYLVKPFAARELLARVRTHVELARTRRAWIAELERTNRELDAFSYSVSHDLRAPLRAIDGFTQALARDLEGQLDERGRDYVARVRRNVTRMGELIDALLELARIARSPLHSEPVDLSLLAAEVIGDLQRQQPERKVELAIEAGLTAQGDRRLLRVVLVNLLGNAWKFTSRAEQPRIEVGALPGAEPAFFVRDNGAGFDMAYAKKLFAPFQRLHDAREFEGTGIGLATSQRAIARHHGRIWAEGVAGKGATFFFTVP